MRLLSRSEELVLLTVWKLEQEAYCVPIRDELIKATGQNWSFGSIYDPLDRLERKKLLKSHLSEPVKERGGRSKRIYRLTPKGLKALIDIKKVHDTVWSDINELKLVMEQ